jgi:hypothetical protein
MCKLTGQYMRPGHVRALLKKLGQWGRRHSGSPLPTTAAWRARQGARPARGTGLCCTWSGLRLVQFYTQFGHVPFCPSRTSTSWAQHDLWTDVVKSFDSFLKKEPRVVFETTPLKKAPRIVVETAWWCRGEIGCTICTTSLTFNNYTFCPQCIYVFCVDLRTNSDYFPLQHWLVFVTKMECVYCTVQTALC